MKATFLSCTLKRSPEPSNTEALAEVVIEALADHGVESELIRLVDRAIPFGTDPEIEGEEDEWPEIEPRLIDSEIVVLCSPVWLGQPSAVAKLALERMDSWISRTDSAGLPLAYNKVGGVVNTGAEDGAHHVIMELAGAMGDIGFTIPPQAFTYWNLQPKQGATYLNAEQGVEWSKVTGQAMAHNLVGVARALRERPLDPPPSPG